MKIVSFLRRIKQPNFPTHAHKIKQHFVFLNFEKLQQILTEKVVLFAPNLTTKLSHKKTKFCVFEVRKVST